MTKIKVTKKKIKPRYKKIKITEKKNLKIVIKIKVFKKKKKLKQSYDKNRGC